MKSRVFGGLKVSRSKSSSISCSSSTSPWLMLPPVSKDNNKLDMVYQFYSLGEDKVLSVPKRPTPLPSSSSSEEEEDDGPNNDAKIVGSSHGWLALFHEHNCDLFLYNPLTGRHFKLPPIRTLPHIPDPNLKRGRGCLTSVVVSSSSCDNEWRAVITYGPEQRLAFCCPAQAPTPTEWTPLGDNYQHESIAYSTRRNLFFSAPRHKDHLEAWNLSSSSSTTMTQLPVSADPDNYPLAARSRLELDLKVLCEDYRFLVVAEQSDELFHVRRFVLPCMGPDGTLVDEVWYNGSFPEDRTPYKTVGFDVHKYDPHTGSLKYMDRTLDGLAFFIGPNDGFALQAADYPGLKPDSIYYTDTRCPPEWDDKPYGGHDVGIFSYRDETFWPCYYSCDMSKAMKIVPAPKWFTPTMQPNLVQLDLDFHLS
ncbi:Unknown protein [Striga hermonthica]|uniref:KIB1-4 beta-propeller domain-containing protein n=1 Tax=Striga hermonthica TaxID=68872 RepID=A0A9N7RCV6_STRHE|nr:Unknown protein [Striga hermonthica]